MGILQDVRFALRAMASSKMLTLVAVAALAVGIGLNTTVFSLVNAVLLEGLPFEDPEEIVHLRAANVTTGQQMGVSLPEFREWRERSTSFQDLAAFMGVPINLSDDEAFPESVNGTLVSANVFKVVRQPVMMGRDFAEEDDTPGGAGVAIIGEGLWRNRYGADPDILGRTIRANGLLFDIVGVMPLGMEFPNNSNLWFVVREGDVDFESRETRTFQVVGRLAEGVSLAEADAEMAAITRGLAEQYPDTNENIGARLMTSAQFYNGGEIRVIFLTLMGAVTFVLFIACANVGNLRLAQALRRTGETSIRTALGASRWRIVRQMLTESLLLSFLGGVAGLGLTFVGVGLFDRAVADIDGKPYWIDFSVDYPVFGYLALVCVGTAVLFGLMPALQASRADVNDNLKDSTRSSLGGLRSRRWTGALIVAELTLTVVLLVGAGLMFRSLLNMQQVDFGVETDGVVVAQILLPRDGYGEIEQRIAFHDRVLEELEGIPGVTAAALVSNAPGRGAGPRAFGIPGRDLTDPEGAPLLVDTVAVSHGFFETFSSPVRGRTFARTDGEGGSEVAIVNPAFAETYWPEEEALGRSLQFQTEDGMRTMRVVGVSETIRQRVGPGEQAGAVPPTVYYPFRQEPPPYFVSILARGADPATVTTGIRTALGSVDADLPAADPTTYDEWLAEATWPYRVFGSAFAVAAVMALILSSAGIFGVTSFSVDQRTQEFGLRVALGATSRNVLWLVTRRGLVQLGIGLILGGLGAIALTRVLRGAMFGVSTSDPVTLLSVGLILSAATLAACVLPARRATRLDPMSAIRFD